VALVVQVVLIGTHWWGSIATPSAGGGSIATPSAGGGSIATLSTNGAMHLAKTHVGLFTVKLGPKQVKVDSGKGRLAQTLATVSLAMAVVAALMVICLVAHKRTPSCAMRTGTAVIALMTFAVSLTASIFATRYVKTTTNARYGVALPLHYVSSLMLLAVAVLLLFKTKGAYGHAGLTPVHVPTTLTA